LSIGRRVLVVGASLIRAAQLQVVEARTDGIVTDTALVDARRNARAQEDDPHAAAQPAIVDKNCAAAAPRLTVLIPTRNESDNVGALFDRLAPALHGVDAEILIVDDSDDDTPEAIRELGTECGVPVRLMHREPGQRRGGLGGAVVAGTTAARGTWVLVMDGDLQHPPEAAVALADIAMRHDVDVVVGTRHVGSGSVRGLSRATRVVGSSGATRLAKALFPRRLAVVSDPMSGLFVFRRSAVHLERLRPNGFKILMEILVRHPGLRVAEMAYAMAPRHAGTSKASLREGARFVRQLLRLRARRLAGQLSTGPTSRQAVIGQVRRMLGFGLVGLSGIAVNTAALWFCYTQWGVHHLVAAALATEASTTWNFVMVEALVYRGRGNGTRRGRAIRFFLLNNLLLGARLPALQWLILLGAPLLWANAVTLVALFLLRFLISDRVIYGSRNALSASRDPVRVLVDLAGPAAPLTASRKRSQYLKYRYDVAGVVTVGSQVLLPELEFFRAQHVADADLDITVRVGDLGPRRPRRRAAMTEHGSPATVHYEEHLGRVGANFRIELGEPINIVVGPLLARSPHVVYTNILEALLRFVMISRGRMLLHSACVSIDGVGIMLSALTDTGKTATVLRMLRDHGGTFLSDDMTVVDEHGVAVCFPKPLTISSHTLRAVNATDLTPKEWRRLQLQSRLHSRGGRSLALALSRFNLPIMGINAITQRLVPPPKYAVDRLVPCRIGTVAKVEELFIIERGAPRLADLDQATTLQRMIENTDDAYGFPPFRYLAPSIVVGGKGYQELRTMERAILSSFLSHVRTRVIASDNFGWADRIPELVRAERDGTPRVPAAAEPRPSWHHAFPASIPSAAL
jgi:putative flippase GtrA